jgi:hypothetical protein
MDGFYDREARHGPITGSGKGFDRAMRLFKRREAQRKRVGKWRKAPATWKKDDGNYIDPDWIIIS